MGAFVIGLGIGVAGQQDENKTAVSAGSTTTPPVALPPGDDTAVTQIFDGDTIAVTGGTHIRLIGIDTPETTGAVGCFGPEASAKLAEVIPVGQRIRLVYDAERLDQFGRTLAYVYRLSDGMFVNLALAKDGYAAELSIRPNVAHADTFRATVAEAREANRGLWALCTTTTAEASTTTAAPTTSPPTTPRPTTVPATTPPSGGGCHASYAGACVPIASDVDCGGGSGNGPEYVYAKGFRVVGPDVYGLDSDNDGIACES